MRPSVKFLYENKIPVDVYCELGVYKGNCFYEVMEKLNPKKGIAVDVFHMEYDLVTNAEVKQAEAGKEGMKKVYEEFMRRIEPYKNKVVVLPHTTIKASKQVNDIIDFLYIDANHTFNSVRFDLMYWYPKVRKGGWIALHDAEQRGVWGALSEFIKYKRINISSQPTGQINKSGFYIYEAFFVKGDENR